MKIIPFPLTCGTCEAFESCFIGSMKIVAPGKEPSMEDREKSKGIPACPEYRRPPRA